MKEQRIHRRRRPARWILGYTYTYYSVLTSFQLPSSTVMASGSFPARLPVSNQQQQNQQHPQRQQSSSSSSSASNTRNWWNEFGGSSDSEEDELSSSSDFEDEWTAAAEAQAQSGTSKVNTSVSPTPQLSTEASSNNISSSDKNSTTTTAVHPHSQPLQTLHKLQQMLDETDYMTSRRPSDQEANPVIVKQQQQPRVTKRPIVTSSQKPTSHATPSHEDTVPEKLWTSKDRSKYKKQQSKMRAQHSENIKLPSANSNEPIVQSIETTATNVPTVPAQNVRSSPPIHQFSSDDDEEETEDDGLGYTLPNVPVYFSDAESETEESEATMGTAASSPVSSTNTASHDNGDSNVYPSNSYGPYYPPPYGSYLPNQHHHQQQQPPPPYLQSTQQPYQEPPPPQQQHPYPQYQNPYLYQQPYQQSQLPYHRQQDQQPYDTQRRQQQQQQQQQLQATYPPYGMYPPNAYPYYPPSYHGPQQQQQQPAYWPPPLKETSAPPRRAISYQRQQDPQSSRMARRTASTTPAKKGLTPALGLAETTSAFPVLASQPLPNLSMTLDGPQTLVEAGSRVNFESIQKISLLLVTVALTCYSAVSPRNLPLPEYNMRFYENVRIVSLAMIAPAIDIIAVFDPRENDINSVIHTFFTSFTVGYLLAFAIEVLVTTVIRLGIFQWFEPNIFSLSPRVPVPILPWVLRENKYRPKRITLFAADFCTSCIASPIIEEYIKLKILQWTVDLPRNFVWVTRTSSKTKRKRRLAEAIVRRPGEVDVVNANRYVTHMLAASVGLKLCDAARRILMYTKPQNANKSFYALCRGLFPIHELCGTMTAIGLAKRNLLGVDMPLWKTLLPAVVVHGMANFRGMKPIFKWNSATPWSEMQLSPLAVPDSSTLPQLIKKGYAKLMWLILLSRVLGYCIKNYYMVNRQALKRTTTYAGNHAAFSAELATAEMLKKK